MKILLDGAKPSCTVYAAVVVTTSSYLTAYKLMLCTLSKSLGPNRKRRLKNQERSQLFLQSKTKVICTKQALGEERPT